MIMPNRFPPYYLQYLEEEESYDAMEQFIEDQQEQVEDHGHNEDETEDEDYEEEEEDEDEDDGQEEDEVLVLGSSRVSQNDASTSAHVSTTVPEALNHYDSHNAAVEEVEDDNGRRTEEGEVSSSNGDEGKEGPTEGEWNRSEIDGLFCPICMEAWTNDGDHQVCCLPCGHIYGMSCIKKWLQQRKGAGKCPQCNKKCTLKDVWKLYASRIAVVDEESQKKIRYLESKCVSLEKKGATWYKKEVEWQKREADLRLQVHQLTERTTHLERLLGDAQSRQSELVAAIGGFPGPSIFGHNVGSNFCGKRSDGFVLQKELRVDGARFFDVDASSQILIIARRLCGMGGTHVLTKMSLIHPYESEDILLPSSTKAVRDLRISTSNCRLALLASLGKKLSVLSMESNNIILTYDLPAAAWSCSWDLNSSHHLYAGLQNGMLLVFDMRQTARPMQSMSGLTSSPVHTIHSLSHNSTLPTGVKTLLTASSVGLTQWNLGGVEERPFLIPETENQGVCISLACCPRSDDIVASFRPKVEMSGEMAVSQPSLTPYSSAIGHGILGCHVLFNKVGSGCYQKLGSACANVSDIRLLKSAIIDIENQSRIFASGDESMCELVLQDLPSFTVVQRLKSKKHPIRDVKYTHAGSQGLLSCLSEDTLQLFCAELS